MVGFKEFLHPPFIWYDKAGKEWRRLLKDGTDAFIPKKEAETIFSCWKLVQFELKNGKMFYRFNA